MIFFESSFRSQLVHNDQSSLRALLHVIIERLCQRYKLTLSLAICLCLASPTQANPLDPSDIHNSQSSVNQPSAAMMNTDAANREWSIKDYDVDNTFANEPTQNESTTTVTSVANVNSLAPTIAAQPTLTEPSLYALLDAEFAADRNDTRRAVTIYKQQSFKEDATAVFERALSLSLRNEGIEDSLQFAKTWQDQNPDHVPAWFYVAHLALRAHDYLLAGETLNRILRYDPRADLSEILIGIYPNTDDDKRELLAALQPLDSEQNASLSVLKAGLLLTPTTNLRSPSSISIARWSVSLTMCLLSP